MRLAFFRQSTYRNKSALFALLLLLLSTLPNQCNATSKTEKSPSTTSVFDLLKTIQKKNNNLNIDISESQESTELSQIVTSTPFFSDWFNFNFDTKPVIEALVDDSNAFILPWKSSISQANNNPNIDVQLNADTQQNDSYSVLAQDYLGPLKSTLFISGDNKTSIENMRLNFSQYDAEGRLLGFLKATQFEFGDITPTKTALAHTSGLSKGFRVSSQKPTATDNNRSTSFNGDIQPGWDVELYQNGILIARTLSNDVGYYSFDDVPLFFGNNQFKLIFYGPHGEVRTENQQLYINHNNLNAKQENYSFSMVDFEDTLFKNNYTPPVKQEGLLYTGVYNFALTDWFSTHSSLQYFSGNNISNRGNYSLGADMILKDRLLLSADFQLDDKSRQKFALSARTQVARHAFSLYYQQQDPFFWQAENAGIFEQQLSLDMFDEDNLLNMYLQQLALNMNGELFVNTTIPLHYQNVWQKTLYKDNYKREDISNQIAYYSPEFSAIHHITWQRHHYAKDNDYAWNIRGFLRLQHQFNTIYSRFQTTYELEPEKEIKKFQAQFSLPLSTHIETQLDFSYDKDEDTYDGTLGVNWQWRMFTFNTAIIYNNENDLNLKFSTQFSFAHKDIRPKNIKTANNRAYQSKDEGRHLETYVPLSQGVKVREISKKKYLDNIEKSFATNIVNASQLNDSLQSGYVVTLGSFSSLMQLKKYWYSIRDKYDNALQQQIFYVEDPDTKRIHLNMAIYSGKQRAIKACSHLSSIAFKCKVQSITFPHD